MFWLLKFARLLPAPPGSSRLLPAPPGSSWLLLAPGSSFPFSLISLSLSLSLSSLPSKAGGKGALCAYSRIALLSIA